MAIETHPHWRPMRPGDLPAVVGLATRLHPDFPERPEVFAEKLRLFPDGCLVVETGHGVAGYCLSHPWSDGPPPDLDRLLGALPAEPSVYFIHDMAIADAMRRRGLPHAALTELRRIATAQRLPRLALVAVNASSATWRRLGFRDSSDPMRQATVRQKYGPGAISMDMTLS